MPDDSTGKYDLLDRLADEVLARCRRGERPSIEEYCARHPHLAAEIRDLLPALIEMEGAKGDVEVAAAEPAPVYPQLESLGDCRILREIGHGGMGVVYEAQQVSLGRRVALKLLTRRLVREPNQIKRFEREARSAARLHHTNIVPVFGSGQHEGVPYYVMQFIQGTGLDVVVEEIARLEGHPPEAVDDDAPRGDASAAAVVHSLLTGEFAAPPDRPQSSDMHAATLTAPVAALASTQTPPPGGDQLPSVRVGSTGPFSVVESGNSSSATILGRSSAGSLQSGKTTYWQGVARIGVQVASALEYAHRQGVVHRDVKPSNLLLDMSGTAWVTDFGLAKAEEADRLTGTGDVLGTLRYMPPEAFEGKADARSDVYSLGLTLYELLALRPAFDERDRNKLIRQASRAEALPLSKVQRGVPRDLETVVQRAIEREPARRYQTAQELADDLQRFINDEPIRARRQTTAEALWRWTRQHKALAGLFATIAFSLVGGLITATVLAEHFRSQKSKQEGLVRDKSRLIEEQEALVNDKTALADKNLKLATENETARQAAENVLCEMQASRGQQAAAEGRPALAALWFARAAEQAASDPVRQSANRLLAHNWARQAILPVAAFSAGDFPIEMSFRPGGDLLLVRTSSRMIVWDRDREKPLPWADGGDTTVSAACWSPDGETLAVGSTTGAVRLFTAPYGAVVKEFKLAAPITALAFSSDGNYLAIASLSVKVWNTRTGEFLPAEYSHPKVVHSMSFNSKGNRLVTACGDRKARVFAVADKTRSEPLFDPIPHDPYTPSPPAFIDQDRGLVTIPDGGHVSWCDAETGKPAGFGTVNTIPGMLNRVVASHKGDWFAACGRPDAEIWTTADKGRASLTLGYRNNVTDVKFDSNGSHLLAGCWDQTARLWTIPRGLCTVPGGKPVGDPLLQMGETSLCAISPDDGYLATARSDGFVRIWKRQETTPVAGRYAGWATRARVSPNGQLLAPGIWHETPNPIAGIDRMVVLTSAGEPAGPVLTVPGRAYDSCVCTDNRTVAVVSREGANGYLTMLDLATGNKLFAPLRLPTLPSSVECRPNHSQVAVLCMNNHVVIVDASSGKLLKHITQDTGVGRGNHDYANVGRVEYTPDGATLVTLSPDGTAVHVYDADSGTSRYPPIQPLMIGRNCRTFALSADGKLLATGVNGYNVARVWDVATGRSLGPPLLHPGDRFGIFHMCFSPDGQRLLTGSKDGQARLWDWKAGTLAGPPLLHPEEVNAVGFAAGGRYALTVLKIGGVRVWELTSGREVAPPIGADYAQSLSVAPDGRHAFACYGTALVSISIDRLVGLPDRPTADYVLLGELGSSHSIENSSVGNLTTEQWMERWEAFHRRYPDFERPTADEATIRTAALRKKAIALLAGGRPTEALSLWRQALTEIDRAVGDARALQAIREELVAEARKQTEAFLASNPENEAVAQLLADLLIQSRPPIPWTPLMPDAVRSVAGTTLTVLGDDSVLASGEMPDGDTFIVNAQTKVRGMTGLRLEALTHPSLPQLGPGRAFNGNFHLSEISLSLAPADAPEQMRQVPFTQAAGHAWVDERGTIYSPKEAIDGNPATSWMAWPYPGQSNTACFAPDVPVGMGAESLTVQLDFRKPGVKKETIGRFRLSVTNRPDAVRDENLVALTGRASGWLRLAMAYVILGEPTAALAAVNRAAAATGRDSRQYWLLAHMFNLLNEKSEKDKSLLSAASASELIFTGPLPYWIWGAYDNKAYTLEKSFRSDPVKRAKLIVSADDRCQLFLNGKKIAECVYWHGSVEVDVTSLIKEKNELVARVNNASGSAGFIMTLQLENASMAGTTYVVTDNSWTASNNPSQPAAARTVGKYGDRHWGRILQPFTSQVLADPLLFDLALGLLDLPASEPSTTASLLLARFRLADRRQSYGEAVASLTRAVQLDPNLILTDDDYQELVRIVEYARDEKYLMLCTQAYEYLLHFQAANRQPGDLEHDRAAYCYIRLGKFDMARAAYERHSGNKAGYPDWVFDSAACRLLAGDESGYRSEVAKVLAAFPEARDYQAYWIARLAADSPKPPIDVSKILEIAIIGHKGISKAWAIHTVGLAYLRAGKFDDAIAWFEKSLEEKSEWQGAREHCHLVNLLGLAIANQKAQRKEKAQEWWRRAQEMFRTMGKMEADGNDLWPWHSHDVLSILLLHREAKELFEKK